VAKMRKTVVNEYGVNIDYDLSVSFMDDDLREEIHGDLAPCTDQQFLTSMQNGTSKNLMRFGSWQKKTLVIKYSAERRS
jgi:hypothetical protein